MGALKGFFYHVFPYYLYDIFSTNVEIYPQNMPSLVLYMTNRAARHRNMWHGILPCRAISGRRAQLSAQARPYVSAVLIGTADHHVRVGPWLQGRRRGARQAKPCRHA